MSSVWQLYRWAKAAYMPVCKDYPLLMPSNRTRTRCFGAKQSSVEKGWLFVFVTLHFSIWLIQGCLLHGTQFVLNKKWQSPHVVYVFWWRLIGETQWFITPSVLDDWAKAGSGWVYKIGSTTLALSSILVRELKSYFFCGDPLKPIVQFFQTPQAFNKPQRNEYNIFISHRLNVCYVTLKTGLTTHIYCPVTSAFLLTVLSVWVPLHDLYW